MKLEQRISSRHIYDGRILNLRVDEVKIENGKLTSTKLKDVLAKERILIRDCCTFMGLDDHYFRVTVRSAKDNQVLVDKIRAVLVEFS